MKFLSDIREGDNIREIYLCKEVRTLQSKVGKSYLALTLQDKTGTADGKVWDINAAIEEFEAMQFISVEAKVVIFQDKPQLNITRIRKAGEGEYDPVDYVPCSKYDPEEMKQELRKFIESVKEPHCRALLEDLFITDNEFSKAFCTHSAAKSMHHGFVGGLLEHTLSVTRVCHCFCKCYPMLKRDLLITAALCHDIGKIEELTDFPMNEYTDEGNLLGHIIIGTQIVSERIAKIEGFPPALAAELKHCIVSHHGKYEYGSPKIPAIMEAMALHFADNLDAKLETFKEAIEASDGKTMWLGFNRSFDSNIRRTTDL